MIKKPGGITAWSYSRYTTYKQCPQKARYLYVDKLKEPPSQAMERGSSIHSLAENYIKGNIDRIPDELKEFEHEFKDLRKEYKAAPGTMEVEASWSFTKDWGVTTWNDWKGCAVRLKVDFAQRIDEATLKICDWKTGKYKPDENEGYLEQLSLYALGALIIHPDIETVQTKLIYLDSGDVFTGKEYHRTDLPALKKMWEDRVSPMLADTDFPARANRFCPWCHFRKDNSGPCEM